MFSDETFRALNADIDGCWTARIPPASVEHWLQEGGDAVLASPLREFS
jgi:hypothetical protein